MYVKDAQSQINFVVPMEDGGTWQYVVMPVRI